MLLSAVTFLLQRYPFVGGGPSVGDSFVTVKFNIAWTMVDVSFNKTLGMQQWLRHRHLECDFFVHQKLATPKYFASETLLYQVISYMSYDMVFVIAKEFYKLQLYHSRCSYPRQKLFYIPSE